MHSPVQPRLATVLTVLTLTVAPLPARAGLDAWTTQGPYGGTILSLAIDPDRPSTLYLGTERSGLFKSTDGAATWLPMVGNEPRLGAYISAVAVDPHMPSRVYAGVAFTGEPTWNGLYRSPDRGETWTKVIQNASGVSALGLAAETAGLIYAGTVDGQILKTLDGGDTWERVHRATRILALAIDPSTSSTVFAATARTVLRSLDGGLSWEEAAGGLPGSVAPRALAIDPADTSVLLLGVGDLTEGVYRSADHGDSWTLSGLDFTEVTALAFRNPGSQGGAPSTVFAATVHGVYQSRDSGISWTFASQGMDNRHVRALALDPTDPKVLYAGTSGAGVYKSERSAKSWFRSSDGIAALWILSLVTDPGDPRTIAAGTRGGLYMSFNGGASWSFRGAELPFFEPAIYAVAIDPRDSATLYAGTEHSFFKSVDRGLTWTAHRDGLPLGARITSLAIDPEAPSVLYAGTGRGAFKSLDGGLTWAEVGRGVFEDPVNGVLIDPMATDTVYAYSTSGSVFVTANGGADWTSADAGLSGQIYSMQIDVVDDQHLYAATSDGFFTSFNGGTTWTGHSEDTLSIRALAQDPQPPHTLYAGSRSRGVFESETGGSSWTPLQPTADNVPPRVASLAVTAETPPRILAGTETSSVFDLFEPRPCLVPGALCLNQSRFLVELEWRDFAGHTGIGHPASLRSDNAGILWFFNESNWELLVKVLDGCRINDRFWVYAAATTNVEYTLRVTDTRTGEIRSYSNPLGRTAAALTETDAFATCDVP